MRNFFASGLAAAAVVAVAACADTPAPIVVATSSPAQVVVVPGPPPQAVVEFKPPPAPGSSATTWQPGHWRWSGMNGATWEWVSGQYVAPPVGENYWVPGQWVQQASGGWSWVEGHWAA